MRFERQKIYLLKEGGADEEQIIIARAKYRGTSTEYTRFSKAMDLPQERDRVTVDGLGNIGQGKYTLPKKPVKSTKEPPAKISTPTVGNPPKILENSGESGIIKKRQNNFDNVEQARDYIRSDKQNKKIFEGQQRKHIEGTKEYNDYVAKLSKQGKYGPSKLTISLDEAQKLIDMFHGTGTIKHNSRGQIIKEIVTISRIIGLVVNDLTGVELETSTFIIKYSKKGTHMIPTYPQRE